MCEGNPDVARQRERRMLNMRGLLIRSPWIERILKGERTWEIRGANTHIRGAIALIRSGSGLVVGVGDLVDVIGPLTFSDLCKNWRKHAESSQELTNGLPYKKTFAWVSEELSPLVSTYPVLAPVRRNDMG